MKENAYGKCRACVNPLKNARIHTGAWKSRKSVGFSTFPTGTRALFFFYLIKYVG
jgi:hypothetical protein